MNGPAQRGRCPSCGKVIALAKVESGYGHIRKHLATTQGPLGSPRVWCAGGGAWTRVVERP